MPPTIDTQIRARIAEFAEELSRLFKQAAVESVQDALGGAAGPARRRGPGRPRKAMAFRRKPGRPRATTATKVAAKAGKRIRRSTEDLEALAGKVHAYVRSNAGRRLEEISAGLKIASKELKCQGSGIQVHSGSGQAGPPEGARKSSDGRLEEWA